MWDSFLRKAEFAGKLAYDVAQRAANSDVAQSGGAKVAPASARGTLGPDDLRPGWRGGGDMGGA